MLIAKRVTYLNSLELQNLHPMKNHQRNNEKIKQIFVYFPDKINQVIMILLNLNFEELIFAKIKILLLQY